MISQLIYYSLNYKWRKIKDIKDNYDYSREKGSKHKNNDFEL